MSEIKFHLVNELKAVGFEVVSGYDHNCTMEKDLASDDVLIVEIDNGYVSNVTMVEDAEFKPMPEIKSYNDIIELL